MKADNVLHQEPNELLTFKESDRGFVGLTCFFDSPFTEVAGCED